MINKILFFIIFNLILVVLANTANANLIEAYPEDFLKINEWKENDIINDGNLIVEASIEIIINKNIKESKRNITLNFVPGEFSGSGKFPAESVKCTLIDTTSGKKIAFLVKNSSKSKWCELAINPNDLEWDKYYDYKDIYINVNYVIPKYVDEEWIVPDKTVLIGTGCIPTNNCPHPKNIRKTIVLPKKIVLRSYTEEGSDIGKSENNRLVIYWSNFNSTEGAKYQNKVVQYTDVSYAHKNFFGGLFLGIAITFVLSLVLTNHYYKKSKDDNKEYTNNIDKKFQSINIKMDNLKKPLKNKKSRK